MYSRSYSLLYQAYKVILTLSVTQVGCERTISKLRHVKNRLKNELSEDCLDSLLLMCVERDVLLRISNHHHRQTSKNKRRNAKTVAL